MDEYIDENFDAIVFFLFNLDSPCLILLFHFRPFRTTALLLLVLTQQSDLPQTFKDFEKEREKKGISVR